MGGTYVLKAGLQSALSTLFPPACIGCGAMVASDFGLCGACWREMAFVGDTACDKCGTSLPGEADGQALICDDCTAIARPWERGRAVFLYSGKGRDLILSLKHADRLDLVRPLAGWLARAVAPIVEPGMIVAPVPLHWSRLLKRRYNQSALLARALARQAGLQDCPDLLVRTRPTESQDGKNRDARFGNLARAIRAHPRRHGQMAGRHVLLVDDVMTSGASLAAAADACLAGGARAVSVAVMARVAKDA